MAGTNGRFGASSRNRESHPARSMERFLPAVYFFSSPGETMNLDRRWTKLAIACLFLSLALSSTATASSITFKITLPASQPQPMTGRLFVIIARANDPEPRLQVGNWRSRSELIAIDVQGLQPGQAATL